jgi:DNA-binding NarL/FixJ family response regulator
MPAGHARAERALPVSRPASRSRARLGPAAVALHQDTVAFDNEHSASEPVRAGGGVLGHHVMVVDDHEIVRSGLVALITGHAELEVTSAVATADEALRLLASGPPPDLVVADLILGKGLDGIQLTKGIKVHHPELPVLVLSGRDEALFAERALEAGASGYVMKDEAVERLFDALDAALTGLSDRARGPAVDDDAMSLLSELRRGNRTIPGIARALARPHVEVERQLEAVRHTLQLPSRASLFLYADILPEK